MENKKPKSNIEILINYIDKRIEQTLKEVRDLMRGGLTETDIEIQHTLGYLSEHYNDLEDMIESKEFLNDMYGELTYKKFEAIKNFYKEQIKLNINLFTNTTPNKAKLEQWKELKTIFEGKDNIKKGDE